jgi:hypothetical protein
LAASSTLQSENNINGVKVTEDWFAKTSQYGRTNFTRSNQEDNLGEGDEDYY